jgi:hypothetical protein
MCCGFEAKIVIFPKSTAFSFRLYEEHLTEKALQ